MKGLRKTGVDDGTVHVQEVFVEGDERIDAGLEGGSDMVGICGEEGEIVHQLEGAVGDGSGDGDLQSLGFKLGTSGGRVGDGSPYQIRTLPFDSLPRYALPASFREESLLHNPGSDDSDRQVSSAVGDLRSAVSERSGTRSERELRLVAGNGETASEVRFAVK